MSDKLVTAFYGKFAEQVELIDRLFDFIPADKLDWRPVVSHEPAEVRVSALASENIAEPLPLLSLGHLLGHLLDCMAGFCAALYKLDPTLMNDLKDLRLLPVNHCCDPTEAHARLNGYAEALKAAFGRLTDDDLSRRLPTVFAPAGESVLTILLGNLEHLINHKFQLFMYLRLRGAPVSSRQLYRFRGE